MKPILFNTEMVRAILEGRKTVTRRIIKNKDIINAWDCESDGTPIAFIDQATGDSYPPTFPCQYQPGDILYVRETWFKDVCRYMFKANYSDTEKFFRDGKEIQLKWRPSIHMPKESARLFLRVTDVRVERLQDIDAKGIRAEGANTLAAHSGDVEIARQEFALLWDSTIPRHPNKFKRYPYYWDDNPWVWVIEFERCEKPEENHD